MEFRKIEKELFNYDATKWAISQLRDRREDIIYGTAALEVQVQSKIGSVTETKGIKLATCDDARRAVHIVCAIDLALKQLSNKHREMFRMRYQGGWIWEIVFRELKVGRATCFRMRSDIVSKVKEKLEALRVVPPVK